MQYEIIIDNIHREKITKNSKNDKNNIISKT